MQITASILSLLATSILLISPSSAQIVQTTNPAIVVVIDSYTFLEELCHTFYSLIRATGFPNAPIHAFTGIVLQPEEKDKLRSCTTRPVFFTDISTFHHTIPADVITEQGANYDYPQTQRFLTKYIWDQDVLEEFDVLMHISDLTCLTYEANYLPGFPQSDTLLNYKSYTIPAVYDVTQHTEGLYENTSDYVVNNGITSVNANMWNEVVRKHETSDQHTKFSDEFEIVRKSFMQSDAVRMYHHHLSDSQIGAQEFFRRHWPAGCVMYMTVALFAAPDSVSNQHIPGIVEKDFLQGNYFRNICREEKGVELASGYW